MILIGRPDAPRDNGTTARQIDGAAAVAMLDIAISEPETPVPKTGQIARTTASLQPRAA